MSSGRRQRLQPPRDDREEIVSRGVPQAVVDRLEVVEVDEEHRDEPGRAARQLERVLHPVDEEQAVREPGERVVERLVGELLLERAPLRDIARGDDHPRDVRVVDQVVEDGLEVTDGAGLRAQPEIAGHGTARRGKDLGQQLLQAPVLSLGEEARERHADELTLPVAEDTLDGRRVVADREVSLEHGDHVARVLDERAEPGRAAALVEIGDERRPLERERDLGRERLHAVTGRPAQPMRRLDDESAPEVALHRQPDESPLAVPCGQANGARRVRVRYG